MNRDHMVVSDRRRRACLTSEAQAGGAQIRKFGGKNLDRDDAPQHRIGTLQHQSHSATAYNLEDLIRAEGTDRGRVGRWIEHGEDRLAPGPFPMRSLGLRVALRFSGVSPGIAR